MYDIKRRERKRLVVVMIDLIVFACGAQKRERERESEGWLGRMGATQREGKEKGDNRTEICFFFCCLRQYG